MLILLVEDEDLVRRLASRALRTAGFEVVEAQDGDEALSLLREHDDQIGAVVSDVIMPGPTGPEVMGMALEEGLREHPVLYVWAFLSHPAGTPVELPDGAAFLSKPFTSSQLVQSVRRLFEPDHGDPGTSTSVPFQGGGQ